MRQERGGKHGGVIKGKGKMHNGLGFQPECGEPRRLEDTAIGVGELATKKRSVGLNKEYTKSNPPHDPLQRDIREWTNPAEKRARSPPAQRKRKGKWKEEESRKRAPQPGPGSPDEEAGQRRLDDFGL